MGFHDLDLDFVHHVADQSLGFLLCVGQGLGLAAVVE